MKPRPKFDETEFRGLYRWMREPRLDAVEAFAATAPRDAELSLRVMSRLRADSVTAPAAILAMFALALSALSSTISLTVSLTSGPEPSDQTLTLGQASTVLLILVTLVGLGTYVWQSTRQRCAAMWKGAFEVALKG